MAPKTSSAQTNSSRVERALRTLKGVDLEIQPIGHHLERRVRAHILLVMLAYYVEWHLPQPKNANGKNTNQDAGEDR